jgi:hypothetical protein
LIQAATTRLSAKDINGGAGLPIVVRTSLNTTAVVWSSSAVVLP